MNTETNTAVAEPELKGFGLDEVVSAAVAPAESHGAGAAHWSWACRRVTSRGNLRLEDPLLTAPPAAGDVALVRVETTEFHKHITTAENRRLRLYPGAQFVGVFGNRYAADAFEAEVEGVDNLHMLTAAGMIGTVKSKNHGVADPTQISLIGYVRNGNSERLNLKKQLFRRDPLVKLPRNLIYVVGTGMNAGKTTTAAKLIKGLCHSGLRVAVCKLTGSVSNRDQDELSAAAEHPVIDFSDFGFPSTYMCTKEELLDLFHTMMVEMGSSDPDVAVVELADGLLQRETAMLLAEPEIKQSATGVILAAESSLSAICGTERLRRLGYRMVAVSGRFTSAPLAMREYLESAPAVPVASSADSSDDLSARLRSFLNNNHHNE